VRAAEAELDGLARAHAEAFLRVVEGARRDDAVRAAG
jgi:hypothetical protein